MKSFLQEVVDDLLASHRNIDDLILVLPSKRAGTFLRTAIAKTANRNLFAPKIFSIESFVEQISHLNAATNTEQLFYLYETYLQTGSGEKDTFSTFAKWGQTLLQDFNEIDRYLIDPKDIFSYLTDIQEITHWSMAEEKSEMVQNYMKFWNNLGTLYHSFNDLLLTKDLGHQGLIYRNACKHLDDYISETADKTHVFIGFNALNSAESFIIQKILSKTQADIYWDCDPYFLEDPIHDAGYFIRQHQNTWPALKGQPLKGVKANYLSKKNIHIIGVPKNVSQTKYVGHLISEIYEKDPKALKNTALVLGDETLLNPMLNAIPAEIDSVNITMGYPLKNTPLASLFTQYLNLHLKKESQGWYYQQVSDFLSHPFIQLFLTENEEDTALVISTAIKQHNWAFVSPQKLTTLSKVNPSLVELLFFKENANATVFLDRCLLLVQNLKEKLQDTNDALGLEYLYKFFTIFNQLHEMVEKHSYINDLKSLECLYLDLLRSETLDFQGEPLQGLQIMGMLESRTLDFETVILTSVNEGILPSGKSNNSFIPFDLKKLYRLPTYKEKDAVYTYHFYRLLQRAKNIYLVYNTEPDVLEGGEKSRLLTQLQTDENIMGDITEKIAAPAISTANKTLQTIDKDQGLMDLIKAHAAKGFSPTSLSNYIRNPLDFYKRNLLGIDNVVEVEETVAANTFGTIVHDTLEDLYRPHINGFLSEEILKNMQAKIKPTVLRHFAKSYADGDITRGKNLLAFNVVLRYVENFIRIELKEIKNHRIKILGIEENLKISLSIPGIAFPVTLKGKLDRIDEKDGVVRIIDYKTGKVNSSQVEIIDWEDIVQDYTYSKAFQLLCYAIMYNASRPIDTIEAGIFSFKNLNAGLLSFATKEKKGHGPKDVSITQETVALFMNALEQLITEICNSDIPLTEKEV
ncbi:PD-(D/E)XK nuclease superfamily protein [Arenibacter nanhaiticus]|uniref:PD-(D/E)XK nuclease superfamily protein n=1 Tax=Arenibacter nanhaiticus TaxID=558155 RepID=A0A1M6CX04_9FLAO|nr:PD-(D/E)XK nuclease family protein [Arenibacter nanhaiticus]SHI65542.1 PD-(D/E)XK nuclease superfamily protein [Arenibacter nanhaiticus]